MTFGIIFTLIIACPLVLLFLFALFLAFIQVQMEGDYADSLISIDHAGYSNATDKSI